MFDFVPKVHDEDNNGSFARCDNIFEDRCHFEVLPKGSLTWTRLLQMNTGYKTGRNLSSRNALDAYPHANFYLRLGHIARDGVCVAWADSQATMLVEKRHLQ